VCIYVCVCVCVREREREREVYSAPKTETAAEHLKYTVSSSASLTVLRGYPFWCAAKQDMQMEWRCEWEGAHDGSLGILKRQYLDKLSF